MEITHILSLSVFILLSIQTVNSLRCSTCRGVNCDSYTTLTCREGTGAACQSVFFWKGDTRRNFRACTSRYECTRRPSFVPQDGGYTIECCYTDLCNSAITTKMSLFLAGFLVLMSLCVSRF
ncbi:uncharacterized protein LOC120977768 isoform X2 [Bufo bufo]|uniref:uncharacterized protein LOC120977768 isoform X2 n=1 Tax=Bufo bufo TaxID=8384 RepID=UPI001ABEE175|nr:uncharacterized protein LOC120977768 isoform X2 [Bufo bufo]